MKPSRLILISLASLGGLVFALWNSSEKPADLRPVRARPTPTPTERPPETEGAPLAPPVSGSGSIEIPPADGRGPSRDRSENEIPRSGSRENQTTEGPVDPRADKIYRHDEASLVFSLPQIDATVARAHADRILELTHHASPSVRAGAVIACRHILHREDVRGRLLEIYTTTPDVDLKSDIVHLWQGGEIGAEEDRDWEITTGFFEDVWAQEDSAEVRWRILDGFLVLGWEFPAPAVEALSRMLQEGFPEAPLPRGVPDSIRNSLENILDHGHPGPRG